MKKKDLLRQLKDEKVVEVLMKAPTLNGNTVPQFKISKKDVRNAIADFGDDDYTGWKLLYNFPVIGQYVLVHDGNEVYEA